MSEAMSSVEIEDVLSSIRRLVSEDLRPASKASVVQKADDKLLLTPALRVVAAAITAPEPAPVPETPPAALVLRPTPLPRLHLGMVTPPREELVVTLQRAVEAQDIEWESEVGDPLPMVSSMEWTEDGWAATGDPVEPTPSEPTPSEPEVLPWDQSDPEFDAAELSFRHAEPDPAPWVAEPDPSEAELTDPGQDDAWADQAEAEAVAQLQGNARLDAETVDETLGESMDQTMDDSGLESGAHRPSEPRPEPRFTGEMSFDEQVLRDLVRDLVREELLGDLGEKITRNVRKLVRAEISRMIASQDLD